MFPNVTASDLGILITALAAAMAAFGQFRGAERERKKENDEKGAFAEQFGVPKSQSWPKMLADALFAERVRNNELRAHQDETEAQLSALKRDKAKQDDEIAELQRRDREKEGRIKLLEEENATLTVDNALKQERINELERGVKELTAQVEELKQEPRFRLKDEK